MVFIIDGSSDVGAHVRIHFRYLFDRDYKQIRLSPKRPIFLHAYTTRSEPPSNKSIHSTHTVCLGSSDPPEKILNIFASEN